MFKPNPIISLVNMMCYLKKKKVLKVTVNRIKNILTKKILIYKILYVNKAFGTKGKGQLFGDRYNLIRHSVIKAVRGIHGNRVTAVYACTLDMLHNTGDEHVGAVGYNVHLQLRAHHVFVH